MKSGQTVHHLRQPETRRLPDVQTRTVTVHLQRLTYFIYAKSTWNKELERSRRRGHSHGIIYVLNWSNIMIGWIIHIHWQAAYIKIKQDQYYTSWRAWGWALLYEWIECMFNVEFKFKLGMPVPPWLAVQCTCWINTVHIASIKFRVKSNLKRL